MALLHSMRKTRLMIAVMAPGALAGCDVSGVLEDRSTGAGGAGGAGQGGASAVTTGVGPVGASVTGATSGSGTSSGAGTTGRARARG
jgi:hypothetical protein